MGPCLTSHQGRKRADIIIFLPSPPSPCLGHTVLLEVSVFLLFLLWRSLLRCSRRRLCRNPRWWLHLVLPWRKQRSSAEDSLLWRWTDPPPRSCPDNLTGNSNKETQANTGGTFRISLHFTRLQSNCAFPPSLRSINELKDVSYMHKVNIYVHI